MSEFIGSKNQKECVQKVNYWIGTNNSDYQPSDLISKMKLNKKCLQKLVE
jgi:hypothetical protein